MSAGHHSSGRGLRLTFLGISAIALTAGFVFPSWGLVAIGVGFFVLVAWAWLELVAPISQWLAWGEGFFQWLTDYPLFPLQLLLIVLLASGGLGAELGAERLFWNEDPVDQLGVGLFVGLLFGVTLFTEYLVNRPTWLVKRLAALHMLLRDRWRFRFLPHWLPTLFPSRNPEVYRLGWYLLYGLLAGLLVLYGLKVVAICSLVPDPDKGWWETVRLYLLSRATLLPFLVGYLGCAGLVTLLLFLWDEYGLHPGSWRLIIPSGSSTAVPIRELILDIPVPAYWLFPSGRTIRERIEPRVPHPDTQSLHGIAMFIHMVALVVLAVLLLFVLYYYSVSPGKYVWTPIALASTVLILFTLSYGVLAYHLKMQRLFFGGIALGCILWNSTCVYKENQYRIRFPNMTYESHTVLWEEEDKRKGKLNPEDADRYTKVVLPQSERYANETLIDPKYVLAEIHTRWTARPGREKQKPKIVLIATSGGGIRAAVWTGVVLGRLENDKDLHANGFRNHIRMITGASGGMVGAALYVTDFEHHTQRQEFSPEHPDYRVETLAADSLSRTAQTLVLRDLFWNPIFVIPARGADWDRGRTLEWKWGLNASERLGGRNPFGRTFRSLRDGNKDTHPNQPDQWFDERSGRRPSLVFSPIMIEDSRRLFITNLDLSDMTKSSVATGSLFLSAVEFHRLFPDVTADQVGPEWTGGTSVGFQVGTAARMSATFPIISPAVSLPTRPARRVVDAGYYDNYGVNLAAIWMIKNREWLTEYTSGVALIEIRAFPLHEAGNRFVATNEQTGQPDPNAGSGDLFTDTAGTISAPLEALFNARRNVARYRNSELIEMLDWTFNDYRSVPPPAPTDQFFFNTWFELDRPAALNWYLTTVEKEAIVSAYKRPKNADRVDALRKWFGTGGKVTP